MAPASRSLMLVTGGGGFLGAAIVRLLLERGHRVRSFSRSFYPELEKLGVDQVRGDLCDARAVEDACHGAAAVFHVAAKAGVWGRYQEFYQANVVGTYNVIKACRRSGIQRLIHTSTPSVIFHGGDMQGVDETAPYPQSFHHHYPRTKALAEQAVRRAATEGLAAVILRPHIIWGPGDTNVIPGILSRAHRLRQIGDGATLIDTIYIDNAAEAHLLAHDALGKKPELSGRIYFISQDKPVPTWDMINAILKAGGKPPIQKKISPAAAYIAGACLEVIYALLRLKGEPPMTRWGARELATSHWFNIDAAKRDLGYTPRVSIEEGLERLKDWLQRINPAVDRKNSASHPNG